MADLDAQIESCYVQKNELEYNLPGQVAEFDTQISDLRSQLSDEDQETFNSLDEQINTLVKEKQNLKKKNISKKLLHLVVLFHLLKIQVQKIQLF